MDWDWTALGVALRTRREVLRLTRPELGLRAGVHPATIKNYEAGDRAYNKIPKSVALLETALGWGAGSALAILKGGEPTLLPEDSAPAAPIEKSGVALADRLPTRIVHELQSGEIFDTWTYDLSSDGAGRVRIISVVIRDHDDPPGDDDYEKRRRDARASEQAQRRMRGLKPLPWEPGDPEPRDAPEDQ
jgi:transcriptional regulator with XRE-family HTH domain